MPLRHPRQHDHDAIAFTHPETLQDLGKAIGLPADIGKGIALFTPIFTDPDQGQVVRILSPPVDHVDTKIKRLGHLK